MTKLMAAMLLAAIAMPGLASAQDGRGGEHHGDHGQPQRAAQPAAPAQPQARAPAPMMQQRPAGDPRRFGGGQPFGGQPQAYQGRPGGWDGQRRFAPGQVAGQPAPQGGYRQQVDGGQFRPTPQSGYGQQRFGGQPGGYAPAPGYRGDPGGRNPFRPDGGYRGQQGRPYDGGARGGGYRSDDRGGGQWNRGWRNDGRYDWNGYRRYNSEAFRLPRYSAPYGWNYGYRRFGVGFVLDEMLFAPDYWIDDPYDYRLPPAYGPYRWVRYYGDALLVDIDSGQVVDVVYGMFY